VLVVLTDRRSLLARIAARSLVTRLRWALNVPVQPVGHQEFALLAAPGR
jgi:hypothetical protein